jgi:hypothetical protein
MRSCNPVLRGYADIPNSRPSREKWETSHWGHEINLICLQMSGHQYVIDVGFALCFSWFCLSDKWIGNGLSKALHKSHLWTRKTFHRGTKWSRPGLEFKTQQLGGTPKSSIDDQQLSSKAYGDDSGSPTSGLCLESLESIESPSAQRIYEVLLLTPHGGSWWSLVVVYMYSTCIHRDICTQCKHQRNMCLYIYTHYIICICMYIYR